MKKAIALIATILNAPLVFAAGQYIASGAVITKVGNTSGNGASFWVIAEQGSGPCITSGTQTNIYFPASAAGNDKIFDRAYAAALTALTTGKHVNIYNYVDATCSNAVAIELISN